MSSIGERLTLSFDCSAGALVSFKAEVEENQSFWRRGIWNCVQLVGEVLLMVRHPCLSRIVVTDTNKHAWYRLCCLGVLPIMP